MNYINKTYILLLFVMLVAACSTNDIAEVPALPELPNGEVWEEKDVDGASVTVKPFLPGDEVSRASFVFDGQELVFGWKTGDLSGVYPTAKKPQEGDEDGNFMAGHPNSSDGIKRIDPSKSSQMKFVCSELDGSQTAKIENTETAGYVWDENTRWTAYFPYKGVDPDAETPETYENRTFSFAGQVQEGLPDMMAYYDGYKNYAGYDDSSAGKDNPYYKASEALACQHLGAKDVMISSESEWNSYRVRFHMRHLGAVIRLFLLAPEEDLIIKNIKLICDTPIFYNGGEFNLKSHPYDATAANKGVNLELGNADCQIHPIGDPQKMIQLDFKGETAHTWNEATMLKRYLVAYMMTYPITYNQAEHGNLYAYVTAYKKDDASKKEYHFVTKPLSNKTMKPGYYYQWLTELEYGLNPIELTATLKSWQEIVGADIDLDLEK